MCHLLWGYVFFGWCEIRRNICGWLCRVFWWLVVGATYLWGQNKNTGDATMYPKPLHDLSGWNIRSIGCWYGSHTYTFNGPFSGTTQVSQYQKGKTSLTVSGSGISWAVCKSAPRSRQITTPAPHHSMFLQAGCPSCRPSNSIKSFVGFGFSQVTWHTRLHTIVLWPFVWDYPLNTRPDHQTSFISFLHLLQSVASSSTELIQWKLMDDQLSQPRTRSQSMSEPGHDL